MANGSRMIAVVLFSGIVSSCSSLQISNSPQESGGDARIEEATVVQLLQGGHKHGRGGLEPSGMYFRLEVALNEPQRVERVIEFVQSPSRKWTSGTGSFSILQYRYQISFLRNDKEIDSIWLNTDCLARRVDDEHWDRCELTNAEAEQLLEIFQFTTSFKSQ